MKKLAVIGKGTAGVFAVCHFLRYTDWEIDWYYDDAIMPQSVGEATTLVPPMTLFNTIGFEYPDLVKIGGTLKTGLHKKYWGEKGTEFHHSFPPNKVGYHFSVTQLQSYVGEKLAAFPRVTVINKNVTPDMVDADYVFVCSGKPKDFSEFHLSEYIPVNTAHVNQCWWPAAKFNDSLHIARKWGWVFGIPLRERCSIGYVYNDQFASLDEVKEDMKTIFEEFDLTPSKDTLDIKFGNYYRKNNFDGRVCYNGNASFFLEPQESTSIATMDYVQRLVYDYWNGTSQEESQARYLKQVHEAENFLMMHYFAGSSHDTPFWKYAQERGEKCMRRSMNDIRFVSFINEAKPYMVPGMHNGMIERYTEYNYAGVFWIGSFVQCLKGLDIVEKLDNIK
jgi:Tryptophan halogenase